MKNLRIPAALLCCLFAGLAFAFEDPSAGGVLTSTGTSVNNTTTAVPFTVSKGGLYAIQCDAPACVTAGPGSATAASCTLSSASAGVQLAALQLYDVPLVTSGSKTADTLAMISVSGTANCRAWLVVVNQ